MSKFFITLLLLGASFNSFCQGLFKIDSLRLIGAIQIKAKTELKKTVFGGISGIDKGEHNEYYLISDDRSFFNPARFYKAQFFYDQHRFDSVHIKQVVFLKDTNQRVFEKQMTDPESIRYHKGLLYWTSEGDKSKNIAPSVRVADTLGNFIRSIPVNHLFQYHLQEKGLRENLALESCSFLSGANQLWIANEAPLYEDGPVPQLKPTRSPVRLSLVNKQTGKIKKQYAYLLEQVAFPSIKPGGEELNSSPEILALSKYEFLVLERGYTEGKGTTVRLFKANVRKSTNIKRKKALAKADFIPAKKQLLIDFNKTELHIDNIEGMSFGHRLSNGNPSIIFVSDDNFSEKQTTQFIAFEIVLKK